MKSTEKFTEKEFCKFFWVTFDQKNGGKYREVYRKRRKYRKMYRKKYTEKFTAKKCRRMYNKKRKRKIH